jgi:flagellar hook-associated protein 2
MASNPAGVEAIFAIDAADKGGLSEAITKIATAASDKTAGFDASTGRYTTAVTALTKEKTKVTDAATAMTTRLTQQYAAMDARVAAYKATQAFMEQQVKIWSKSE